MSSLYDRSANAIRWLYDQRLDGPPVLDAARHFPVAEAFAAHWKALRVEALALAAGSDEMPRFHELMASQTAISANDQKDLRMFVVKAYGVWVTRNLRRCPVLAKLVASEPTVLSAALSFLAPGKHMPRHRGPMRGVIRYYLGLSVPPGGDGRPGALLILDDQEYVIGEGQWLLWDDTYSHEVFNRSGQVRVALLLDVRRRGMPADMAALTRVLIAGTRLVIRLRGGLSTKGRGGAGGETSW